MKEETNKFKWEIQLDNVDKTLKNIIISKYNKKWKKKRISNVKISLKITHNYKIIIKLLSNSFTIVNNDIRANNSRYVISDL